jgi:RNA polymerase sigma factor (sigma-70 family)
MQEGAMREEDWWELHGEFTTTITALFDAGEDGIREASRSFPSASDGTDARAGPARVERLLSRGPRWPVARPRPGRSADLCPAASPASGLASGPPPPPRIEARTDSSELQEPGDAPLDVELGLIQGYLAVPRGFATPEQELAWNSFFDYCQSMIRRIIRKYHDHWDKVDDLSQEVWVAVLRGIPDRPRDGCRGTLRGWVAGIARNVASGHPRRRSRSREQDLTEALVGDLVAPDGDPAAESEPARRREQLREIIARFAATLRERNRRVVVMHWLEDRPSGEIAAELGISEFCVRSILRRAKLKLREILRRHNVATS